MSIGRRYHADPRGLEIAGNGGSGGGLERVCEAWPVQREAPSTNNVIGPGPTIPAGRAAPARPANKTKCQGLHANTVHTLTHKVIEANMRNN